MPLQTQEQLVHDRVNLRRLVKSLESAATSAQWEQSGKQTWIQLQATLHKVEYARRLLGSVESNTGSDPSTSTFYQNTRDTLDKLGIKLLDVQQRITPQRHRPELVLPTVPIPELPAPLSPSPPSMQAQSDELPESSSSHDPNATLSAQDLLLSPSDTVMEVVASESTKGHASESLFSGNSSAVLAPASTGAILQNSRAIQEELSEQLAQMATQLKRNALHFATSLENDKGVVLEAQEKLERNYDVMTKERIRLRDHHSKSWGTTWITILSIVVAIIGFVLTLFVIRLT